MIGNKPDRQGLIYYNCAGFGQILRSFSFNRPHYSPQTIEQSDSNRHNLVTITNLGQPPSQVVLKIFFTQAFLSVHHGTSTSGVLSQSRFPE